MNTHKAEIFRRRSAGACLILAPLVLASAQFVHPGEGEGGMVQSMANNAGRLEAASLLTILSSVIFVPAFVGLLRLVRNRGSFLGHLGASLAIIGVIGHAVWAGFEIVLLWMVGSGIDRGQLAAVVDGGPPEGVAITVVLLMFMAGFFLGMVFLAAGLLGSRTVPWWVALLIGVGPMFDFLPVDNELVFKAGLLMFVIGLGLTGWTLLRGPVNVSAGNEPKLKVSAQPG